MTREVHGIIASSRSRFRPRVAARLLLAAIGTAWLLVAPSVHGAGKTVDHFTATGVVDNVMASYLVDGIAQSAKNGAAAVVIELDTPGGSLDSMNQIVTAELEARVPVIVWVAPAGAAAASAGTFITLAGNLAYMAPGTNIGAASPVGQNGQDITGTEGQKVMSYAISKITAIAEERGRNVQWAVSAVQQAVSAPASEAVAKGVVNGLASTMDDVLAAANGQTVTLGGGQKTTVDVAGADVAEQGANPFQDFLHLLSDPNIAFVLFTIGFYGLIFEVVHPNLATGTIGALAIILALIGFGSLPLNVGGLLLIVLGLVLVGLELTVTSHGLLTVGGIVAFVLGASALYSAPSSPTAPDVSVAFPLIATMAVTTALFMLVAVGTVVRYRRRLNLRPAIYGAGGSPRVPTGTVGEVRTPLGPIGIVYAAGEEWSAKAAPGSSAGAPIQSGARVIVVDQQGLTLIVEPAGVAGPAS